MPLFRRLRLWLCVLAALLLLCAFHTIAFAARPEDEPEKGSEASASTRMDGSLSTAPSSYDPVPVDVETVMIGLRYGEDALYDVYFSNPTGQGFLLGSIDESRVFRQTAAVSSSELYIHSEHKWHLLFDGSFDSLEDAKTFAGHYWNMAVPIELDGEIRVIYGSFDYYEEIQYLIRRYGFQGSAWQDHKLGVYDGWGRLCYLAEGDEELAVKAVSDGKPLTDFDGERYYGAFLLRRDESYRLSVVNVVGLEDYVKGVIPYEMSPSWPMEALKAQAVCARTYAAYNLNAYDEFGFDLTNDTESQVYRGVFGADEITDAAVEATAGLFVRYRGELCEIYYFASDGGATEDGAHVFDADRPYLAGKNDPFEQAVDFAVMRWDRWRYGDDVGWQLREKGYEIGTVVQIVPTYSELGNVIAMRYLDADGRSVELEGRKSYSFLGLSSARFTVEAIEDGFQFTGIGWGHNCGMSQWGAHAMAAIYGYSADEIVRFYFTGAYIG